MSAQVIEPRSVRAVLEAAIPSESTRTLIRESNVDGGTLLEVLPSTPDAAALTVHLFPGDDRLNLTFGRHSQLEIGPGTGVDLERTLQTVGDIAAALAAGQAQEELKILSDGRVASSTAVLTPPGRVPIRLRHQASAGRLKRKTSLVIRYSPY